MKRSKPKLFGTIIAEVGRVDIYYEYKYFIQKIKRADDSTIEYRICYYTLDNKKNKVMFVRAPSIISPKCFKKLIQKASKKKGFL